MDVKHWFTQVFSLPNALSGNVLFRANSVTFRTEQWRRENDVI